MDLDAARFLETLQAKHARAYTEAISDMVVGKATGDRVAFSAARSRLADVITETMGAAEVLGASLVLRRAAALIPAEGLAFKGDTRYLLAFADAPTQTVIPRVTFSEAVQDMVDRTPVTIRGAAERTAQRITELYGQGRVVAFARSAEVQVTERVQSLVAEALREGIPEARVGTQIVQNVDFVRKRTAKWSEGYARMAFRTNVNTAVTAGRFRQVQDPDIKRVVPAFMYDSVGDADTRDNHNAGDGKVMLVDNQNWAKLAPPLGYNCRCQVRMLGLPELRRMGRINSDGSVREDRPSSSWHADPGFRAGGRADLTMNVLGGN